MLIRSRLLLALCASLLISCGPSQKQLEREARLKKIEQVTKDYFGSKITAGTFGQWGVISILPGPPNTFSDAINTIVVLLDVPNDSAADIIRRSSEAQLRAVGWNACPRKAHPLWGSFSGNDFMVIQASTGGTVFIDVDCKRWGQ